jgi:hypothetical protein
MRLKLVIRTLKVGGSFTYKNRHPRCIIEYKKLNASVLRFFYKHRDVILHSAHSCAEHHLGNSKATTSHSTA